MPLHNANLMLKEWDVWKKHYITPFPLKGKTVLDIGAGSSETALLCLHGASKVIAMEP